MLVFSAWGTFQILPYKAKKKKRYCSYCSISSAPSLVFLSPASFLWKLISSDMTELWKPREEVLQKLCHNPEHGRKLTPRQVLDAARETSDDCLAVACLTLPFMFYFNYSTKKIKSAQRVLCSVSLVLPRRRRNFCQKKWRYRKRRGNWCWWGSFLVGVKRTQSRSSSLFQQSEETVCVCDIMQWNISIRSYQAGGKLQHFLLDYKAADISFRSKSRN